MWRSVYRPDEGAEWASLDFSQQEPKWLIHWAVLTGARHLGQAAFEAAVKARDAFRADPSTDSYDAFSKFTGLKRKDAKEVYLGRVYGMGGAKMSRKLGLETQWIERRGRRMEVAGDEAQGVIDRFDNGVPYAQAMAKLCEAQAKRMGFVRTYTGRRCRFPQDEGGNYDFTHKALNRLIQGSSACQVKETMVAIARAGHQLQLQVHDELDLSVRDSDEAREIAKIMVEAVPLELPMKVDVELGLSWGESMKVGKPEKNYVWNLGD
jgi:DNA polymerase I-like protein with 3'-5' exonuclease and polymerase domains